MCLVCVWGSWKVWEGIKEASGKDHEDFVSHWEGFCFYLEPRESVNPGPKPRQKEEKWVGGNIHVVYILLHESDSI